MAKRAFSVRSERRSIAVYPSAQRPSGDVPRPATRQRFVLRPPAFRVTWWCIFCLHVFCGTFVFMFAALHAFMAQPRMFAYSYTVLQIPLQFLQWGRLVCGGIACAHFAIAGRMIYRSLRQRQLSFVWLRRRDASNPHDLDVQVQGSLSSCVRVSRSLLRPLLTPFTFIRKKYQQYFGVDGLFGLNGAQFEAYITFREAVEILSQLYQTYQLSCVIAGRWINRFAVAVLVLNTVSTPLVGLVCRGRHVDPFTRRLATLVADLTLDFCSSFVIAISILLQMVSDFDWATKSLPPHIVYSDAWLARVVACARLLLISSTLDLISILILNLAIVGALAMVAVGIRRDQSASASCGTIDARNGTLCHSHKLLPRASVKKCRLWQLAIECGFVVTGIFVLATHVKSQRDVSIMPACLLHVDAWFVEKFPCAVVRINFQKLPSGDGMASILDLLEPSVVTAMIIAHCSSTVIVPPQLNAFSHIRQLKFVNVSSITWSDGVRIDDEHHPHLGYILFGHTNMTEVPTLLRHNDLPESLGEIEWSHSNITELPSDIGRFWANREWIAVSFDHTQLKALPHSFHDIAIQYLWLVDNKFQDIPASLFTSKSLRGITLSGNPISELPELEAVPTALTRVFAEYTNIAHVPSWLENWYIQGPERRFSLYGSDYCEGSSLPIPMVCAKDFGSIRGTIDWEFVWMNQRDP